MRWLTIFPGLAFPLTIRSRRYSLYFFYRRLTAAHGDPFVKEIS